MTDNSESCQRYMQLTRRTLFKWLNRRSQRKSYTWDGFLQALGQVGWPQVRVRVNLTPFAPLNG
jgi:RNA-directed DNA polymerase